ncbi:hypothetical protein QJS66_12370 [Kocuria rhizophila]|nr:hypothetical protein QJS66_12370 [Kocuria rhizophila]
MLFPICPAVGHPAGRRGGDRLLGAGRDGPSRQDLMQFVFMTVGSRDPAALLPRGRGWLVPGSPSVWTPPTSPPGPWGSSNHSPFVHLLRLGMLMGQATANWRRVFAHSPKVARWGGWPRPGTSPSTAWPAP